MTYGPKPRDPAERFWEKVNKEGDCWLWTAATNNGGYGQFDIAGRKVLAHRYSYELVVGAIPAGLELDHRITCPKRCVTPWHLRPATSKQNKENKANRDRGVVWHKGRWEAYVKHNYKTHYLGRFDSREEAALAAREKRKELFTHNDTDQEGQL